MFTPKGLHGQKIRFRTSYEKTLSEEKLPKQITNKKSLIKISFCRKTADSGVISISETSWTCSQNINKELHIHNMQKNK